MAIILKTTCNSIKVAKIIYKLELRAKEIEAISNLLFKMIMIRTFLILGMKRRGKAILIHLL
jgi:hypothetical protein